MIPDDYKMSCLWKTILLHQTICLLFTTLINSKFTIKQVLAASCNKNQRLNPHSDGRLPGKLDKTLDDQRCRVTRGLHNIHGLWGTIIRYGYELSILTNKNEEALGYLSSEYWENIWSVGGGASGYDSCTKTVSYTHIDVYKRQLERTE